MMNNSICQKIRQFWWNIFLRRKKNTKIESWSEHLDKLVTNKEIDYIIFKNFPKGNSKCQVFLWWILLNTWGTPMFQKLFRTQRKEKTCLISCYEGTMTLRQAIGRHHKKRKLQPASPTYSDLGLFTKILLVNWLQQHIKSIRYRDKWGLTQECKLRLTKINQLM